MTNRIESQLPKLLKGKLEGITLGKGMVVPAYDGHSLVNLPASICRWLEIPAMGQQPLAAEYFKPLASSYKKVILIVVDGLGLSLFRAFSTGWRLRDAITHLEPPGGKR